MHGNEAAPDAAVDWARRFALRRGNSVERARGATIWAEVCAGALRLTWRGKVGGRLVVLLRGVPAGAAGLTPMGSQVLRRAAEGRSLKRIASELGVTVSTVSYHLDRGLERLGLEHRAQLSGCAND